MSEDEMSERDRLGQVGREARTWFEQDWDVDATLGHWWARLAESSWGFPQWPEGRFGHGLTNDEAIVVSSERRRVGAPRSAQRDRHDARRSYAVHFGGERRPTSRARSGHLDHRRPQEGDLTCTPTYRLV